MPTLKKSLVLALLMITSLVLTMGTSWAARKNVIIAEQSWTGSTVICQVMKHVLETKLDIPVKITQLAGAVTWVGMDKGDVDVFSDIWKTSEIAGVNKYAKEKKSVEVVLSYPQAPQGWYIPKYVAEKYGIKTIDDLRGQEKIFDMDNNGQGDIWAGPSSWKVSEQSIIKIRDYNLDFNPIVVEQWAWLATLKSAILKKQPVIFYYWEPEWLFTEYDLVKIEEPPHNAAEWKFVQGKPDQSKLTCGFPSTDVLVGISKKMEKRLPKAYKFFKNWSIPITEVNRLIAMVTDLPDSPKLNAADAAKKWVAENPEIVNAWLK